MQTTLYRSLERGVQIANESGFEKPYGVGDEYHIHIPEDGCLLSPSVDVFRTGSNDGYRFKVEAVKLQAVVSLAMPNKNWSVKDSPVDAPRDVRAYEELVLKKLSTAVHTAAVSGANVFVIPDVGCGVFQNDPRTVGKLLGDVVKQYGPYFDEIHLTGKEEFQKAVFYTAGQEWPKKGKRASKGTYGDEGYGVPRDGDDVDASAAPTSYDPVTAVSGSAGTSPGPRAAPGPSAAPFPPPAAHR
jgi:hypothetical protein